MYHAQSAASPGGTLEVSVHVSAQLAQPVYRRADGRLFVPGIPGRAYTLRVRNKASVRAEVIATVDGRHVLKDEPGDPHSCHGLVIPAYGTYEFRGWRVSDAETREFLFGDPAASVAAQATGSVGNVGVIGFAAWREKERYPDWQFSAGGYASLDSAMPVATASAGAPVARSVSHVSAANAVSGTLGTGIGASQDDHVGRTDFTRTGTPDILVIGYDTEAVLTERGIIGPADPDAFPGARTGYEKFAIPQP
jgi:hypothetical protein